MIAPLGGLALTGVVWYQGEANCWNGSSYRPMLTALINEWRTVFKRQDLPFLVVQLPNHKGLTPELREAQMRVATEVPRVGIVCTIDVGDPEDIHPKNKRPVGERLALVARSLAYGETVTSSGPRFAGITIDGSKAIVRFTDTDGGLVAKDGALTSFTLAGADGNFVPAEARIVGTTVEVKAAKVSDPKAVRYAWANLPAASLFNGAGLPAFPFRSDNIPPKTLSAQEQHDARMAWWREAKFGMFIHWGIYALPAGGEWYMRVCKVPLAKYAAFAGKFNPVKFNADEWATVAETAGMKYMVPTAKHHDGFAMFRSQASSYNIYDATPFKRDPMKELSLACPKHGIRFGVYYSAIADWGHPGGGVGGPKWDKGQEGDLDEYIKNVSLPQVKELLTNYGPIAVMWFDSDGVRPKTLEQTLPYISVLKLQPDLIVNRRLHGVPGDFESMERHMPVIAPTNDWELCDTMIEDGWGYCGRKPVRALGRLLPELCEAWGKGGNVLLNVAPDAEGVIPEGTVERLKQIGQWMKVNGEAIYGSVKGPFAYVPWGWETTKGDRMYLLVSKWPANGKLILPSEVSIEKAWLVSDPKRIVTATVENGRTILSVPLEAPDPIVSVVALKLKAPVSVVNALTVGCAVTVSEDPRGGKTITSQQGVRWQVKGDKGVVTIDLGKTQTFDAVRLWIINTEVKQLLLEVKSGNTWTEVFNEGNSKTGDGWIKSFAPVSGEQVRLTISAKKPGIDLRCFELFPPL